VGPVGSAAAIWALERSSRGISLTSSVLATILSIQHSGLTGKRPRATHSPTPPSTSLPIVQTYQEGLHVLNQFQTVCSSCSKIQDRLASFEEKVTVFFEQAPSLRPRVQPNVPTNGSPPVPPFETIRNHFPWVDPVRFVGI